MATMFRVSLPDGGPAAVSTGVVLFSTCAATEIAVLVGDSVARNRCGSELRAALMFWAQRPRALVTVAGGSVRTFRGAPGLNGDALEAAAATELNSVAPDETQIGIVVGSTAAAALNNSNALVGAIQRALDKFPSQLGV